jgi:hypothetical protein
MHLKNASIYIFPIWLDMLKASSASTYHWGMWLMPGHGDDVGEVVRCFSRLAEERGLDDANRYLLTVSLGFVYSVLCGRMDQAEASRKASELRDALLEVADSVNPFVQSLLGVIEEGLDAEGVEEALDRAYRLWREERLDKLEV